MAVQLSPTYQRAWVNLLSVQAKVGRSINARLETAGMVSMEEYDALLALEEAPGGMLRLYELSERLLLTRSGITRLVDRLADRGLVERVASAKDRRGLHARVTTLGVSERKWAWPVYEAAIAELFAATMLEEEARVLEQVLGRMLGS